MPIAGLFLGILLRIGCCHLDLEPIFLLARKIRLVFGGMLRFDWLGFLFKMFFVFAAGVTALFFMDTDQLKQRAEAYLLASGSHDRNVPDGFFCRPGHVVPGNRNYIHPTLYSRRFPER